MNPLQAFRSQLGKLRRLAQPYFLPVEDTSGWQFLLLIVAMLAVVVGTTLLLLTGAVAVSGALIPELQARFLPGIPQQVEAIWSGPVGLVVMVLFAASLGCFGVFRGKLRQGRWLPWLLLGVITLLILVINGINVGISFVARNIENALVAYQADQFWQIVAIYAFCLVLALPIRALQSYLIPRLGLLWREWLSGRLLTRYLSNRVYYVLNPNDEAAEEIDNPDQRISQDAASFTGTSLSVTVEIVSALLTFVSFILVLWSISSKLALWLLIYSLAGTAVIVFASRKLVALNYDQLRLEADFRYGLVHIRDNAESIAFYRGEQQESREAERRLGGAIRNYNKLIVWEALISVIQRSYDYFSRFLPWLVIAPIYFAKEVDFGVFGQASIAFSQVLFSVSYIVNNIDRLAAFSASISRLEGFQGKVEAISRSEAQRDLLADEGSATSQSLLVRHVDLVPPGSDRRLIHDLSLEVGADQRVLVVGPSGCGKTSFLRLVSGLWPPAAGEVERPPLSELLFIPQKPYMLLGSLREQLCYPQDPQRFSDEHLRSVLEEVRLGALVQRYPDFDIKQDWPRLLSLGEQQRLAFARLLLNSPRFVVLDEATSALDVSTEEHLYALLTQREMAFVSVGHRPTLKAFHNVVLELDGQGGWKLMPATSYTFNSGV
ncbi:ABC transporter ATP-binding protein/permease [Synechococcus sp. HK05]|uniref:ABC transporter ATP-binding protein/permease n=1 Tax=Synechococcus sp. HK05 TaxID=2725975 RepID=UPI001C38E71F|nr:ABC transporter ATP-binding protein/permease [Synechococcus sp. HK05]MBV2351468.1 ABC transporter ATP-binding protein/permease [Synechococcus sp. HK05]